MAGQFKSTALTDRILAKCKTNEESGCIEWTGYTLGGYGRIRWEGKRLAVHRAMYESKYGDIPDEMCACHKCDNTRCVNPDHIFIGTRTDNNADKVSKGRQSSGSAHSMSKERHPLAKLTQDQVDLIRSTTGISQYEMAATYGVSQSTISQIKNNLKWKDLNHGVC